MKTIIITLWLAAALVLSAGCSDIGANSTPASNLTEFDGVWDLSASTKAGEDREENCGYGFGKGVFKVSGARITGNITDDSGYAYELEGSVDDSGKIDGALTYQGYDAATFQGIVSTADFEGGGDFEDINGCPGIWKVEKQNGEQTRETS